MADSQTTHLALTKPEVGGSDDTWGNKINADLDTLDAMFAPDGTGPGFGPHVTTGNTMVIEGDVLWPAAAELPAKQLKGYSGTYADKGTGSGAITLDFAEGNYQRVQVSGNTTFAFTNLPSSGIFWGFFLVLVNGGGKTINWPSVNWVLADGSFSTDFADTGWTLKSSGIDFVVLFNFAGTTYGRVLR